MEKNIKREIVDGALCFSENGTCVLRMNETKTDNAFVIQLDGNLISDAVPDVQDELESLTIMGFDLELDMGNVQYISSACETALLKLQLKMDERQSGRLTLRNVPANIMDEFISTGLSELLRID